MERLIDTDLSSRLPSLKKVFIHTHARSNIHIHSSHKCIINKRVFDMVVIMSVWKYAYEEEEEQEEQQQQQHKHWFSSSFHVCNMILAGYSLTYDFLILLFLLWDLGRQIFTFTYACTHLHTYTYPFTHITHIIMVIIIIIMINFFFSFFLCSSCMLIIQYKYFRIYLQVYCVLRFKKNIWCDCFSEIYLASTNIVKGHGSA